MTQKPSTMASPLAGMVFDLAVTPAGVWYAATATGLYRSASGNEDWEPAISRPWADLVVTSVAVGNAPHGSGESVVVAGSTGRVIVSRNGGASWTDVPLGLPPPVVSSIAIAGETVLVGTLDDGIFRSPDAGQTWGAANAGLLDRHVLCLTVAPDDERIVYAGTSSGLALSRNAGRSWRDLGFAGVAGGVERLLILTGAGGTHEILAATESAEVWQTGNGGTTWTPVVGLPATLGHVAALCAVGGRAAIAGERHILVRGGHPAAWQALAEIDPARAPIVAAAALDPAAAGSGFLVALEDGSLQVLELPTPAGR